jgi:ADP-ribose pyrophosphatase
MSEETTADRPDGIVFAGRRFQVRLETVPYPLGGVRQFEIVQTPAAAAVVPVLAGGTPGDPMVVLVEQERPAIGGRTLEIPAGLLHADPPEEPEQTAARELREETGYDAGALSRLTSVYPSPGISDEIVHIFLATDVTLPGPLPGPEDPTEIAGLRTLTLREAVGMAARGEIRDAKTTVGLLLAGATLIGAASRPSQAPSAGGGNTVQMDPTNPPFPRDGGASHSTAPRADAPDLTLSFESILSQEFNYANTTAYQAMEDRARIFNLYLLLVGVLASALTAIFQVGAIKNYILPLTFLLLLLAGLLGVVFFMLIIRLRQAFRDSVIAMNRVKEYYIKHLIPHVPDAAVAFHWRLRTIPRGERLGSVTYLVSFTIAFLGSLCFAGAFVVGAQYLQSLDWLGSGLQLPAGTISALALLIFLLSILLHTIYYRRKLNKKADERILKVEEEIIGPSAEH